MNTRNVPLKHTPLQWADLMQDASLQDLPYKIELNEEGVIQLTPSNFRHSRFQSDLCIELKSQLGGVTAVECAVETRIGIRVPDVVWMPQEFHDALPENPDYLIKAPPICIEVLSPSNPKRDTQRKIAAYLDAGAEEVWLVADTGAIRYFNAHGEQVASRYPVKIVLKP